MPEDKIKYYKDRDPVDRARDNLINMGKMSAKDVKAIEAEIEAEFEAAVKAAEAAGEVTVEEFREFVADY